MDYNKFETMNEDNTLFNDNYDIYNNELLNYHDFDDKAKYNIAFEGVREDLEKEKNSKSNNIYLNFYNKHTKNKVLKDFSDLNKKYYNNNMENIKEKEYKFKKKKEEEEKVRKRKEKEDSNQYRKEQMLKLYSNQLNKFKNQLNSNNKYINIKPKVYNKQHSNIISKSKPKATIKPYNKIKPKIIKKREISLSHRIINNKNNENNIKFENKISNKNYNLKKKEGYNKIIPKGNFAILSKREYDNIIKELKEETKKYINELDKLKNNGNTIEAFQKQIKLAQLIDKIKKDIEKYELKIGLKIIDN